MSPPSSPPAGVPASNAKYAVVAVVLLLAVGGIFYWRSRASTPDAPAPIPTVPSTVASLGPPPNPKLDDIPPPPPPEEKPEGGVGGPHVVYVPGGGCAGTCSQKFSTPELGQALAVRGNQARRCYNSALASDSNLRGHVTIAVRISPTGSVCSANVAANDMGSSAVASCAANIFRQSSFPAPRGGCVDATVPLSFVPMGQ